MAGKRRCSPTPATPGRISVRSMRTARRPGTSQSSAASSRHCPKDCGLGRGGGEGVVAGAGLCRAPVPHRQEPVPAQAAALSRPGQEHGATAHPVRPGQPGDRQENPARAGPSLITPGLCPAPKTTLENPVQSRFSTGAGRSQTRRRPKLCRSHQYRRPRWYCSASP
jgi:hypothetical protein